MEPIFPRLVMVIRSFEYSTPKMYTSSPYDAKEAQCIDAFKQKLEPFLFTGSYSFNGIRTMMFNFRGEAISSFCINLPQFDSLWKHVSSNA